MPRRQKHTWKDGSRGERERERNAHLLTSHMGRTAGGRSEKSHGSSHEQQGLRRDGWSSQLVRVGHKGASSAWAMGTPSPENWRELRRVLASQGFYSLEVPGS